MTMALGFPGGDELSLPASVPGKVGQPLKIQAEGPPVFFWEVVDGERVVRIPQEDLKDGGNFMWLVPTQPGEVRVIAFAVVGKSGQVARTTVLVEGKPIPPGPTPTPDLRKRLQDAYSGDGASAESKKAQLSNLTGMYQALKIATPLRVDITTTTGLKMMVLTIGTQMKIPEGGLVEVRKVIGAEVQASLGPVEQPLTDALRASAVDAFDRISKALGEVK